MQCFCCTLMFRDLLFEVVFGLELVTAVFAYPCVCGSGIYGCFGFAASAVSAEHTERTEGKVAKASFAARIALGLDRCRILGLGQVLQIFAPAFGTAYLFGCVWQTAGHERGVICESCAAARAEFCVIGQITAAVFTEHVYLRKNMDF